MSGPFCKTCGHYRPMPLGDEPRGECMDPTKIIYSRAGNRINSEPEVWPEFECSNHTSVSEGQNDG